MSGLAVTAALAAIAGLGVGWLYFYSLRPVAERMVGGSLLAVALQVARLVGLGLFLYFCARIGVAALLPAAAGVLAGGAFMLQQARKRAP